MLETISDGLFYGDRPSRSTNKPVHANQVAVLKAKYSDMMTLVVGPEKVQICCHKSLLGYYSQFFNAACFGPWAESATAILKMPDDEPFLIQLFVDWVYTGNLKSDPAKRARPEYLWILGDRLLSPEFCNEAMYLLMHMTKKELKSRTRQDAIDIFNGAPKDTALRRYFTDVMFTMDRFNRYQCEGFGIRFASVPPTEFEAKWIRLIFPNGPIAVTWDAYRPLHESVYNQSRTYFQAENEVDPAVWQPGKRQVFRDKDPECWLKGVPSPKFSAEGW